MEHYLGAKATNQKYHHPSYNTQSIIFRNVDSVTRTSSWTQLVPKPSNCSQCSTINVLFMKVWSLSKSNTTLTRTLNWTVTRVEDEMRWLFHETFSAHSDEAHLPSGGQNLGNISTCLNLTDSWNQHFNENQTGDQILGFGFSSGASHSNILPPTTHPLPLQKESFSPLKVHLITFCIFWSWHWLKDWRSITWCNNIVIASSISHIRSPSMKQCRIIHYYIFLPLELLVDHKIKWTLLSGLGWMYTVLCLQFFSRKKSTFKTHECRKFLETHSVVLGSWQNK